MFVFALLIGIYSYIIFFLGIFGLLYKNIVILWSVLFWIGACVVFGKRLLQLVRNFTKPKGWKVSKQLLLFVILLTLQACVNLIGTLGPELAFDALWYHLTLPKLWLSNHAIEFIPGGLLYYSAMPKLAELLYVGALGIGNEITAKFIHFLFGLLTCLAIYKLSRKFFTPFISLIAVVIFYSNLVVAWESITGYIDLVRAFFEILALWAFVNWWENQKQRWLLISAVMVGLAITTKLLAIGSLIIFSCLISYYFIQKKKFLKSFAKLFFYWIIALAIPLPWFIFSFIHTGNPIYPLFSPVSGDLNGKVFTWTLINPVNFLLTSWNIFTRASDPISPLYIIFLPLLIIFFKRFSKYKIFYFYAILSFLLWYLISKVEGSRLLLPGLTVFSILCAACINEVWQNKKYGTFLGKFLIILVVFSSLISVGYRFMANKKYIPVILGKETKAEFLSNNLNFAFADFYDTDGYFKKHIKPTDKVLLYGFHNIYYVDFPFIDASWRKPEDSFNYIATQNAELPEEFNHWVLVYENEQTMVKLYKEPERLYSQTWLY